MMKHILFTIFLLTSLGACGDPTTASSFGNLPTKTYSEAIENKNSGMNFVRSAKVEFGGNQIAVDVVVDEGGNVIEASTEGDEEGLPDFMRTDPFRALAETEARKWMFKPFIEDGSPVKIRTKIYINLYPPEILPDRKVPFPEIIGDDFEITLRRTSCYGTCPDYSVKISGNGDVRYDGSYYTLVEGKQNYAITRTAALDLLEDFRKANFWSLRDKYESSVTDNPTYFLTLRAGKQEKTIADYVGLEFGMPWAVRELENKIDKVADTERWITGNPQTAQSLNKAGFSFRSKEAQNVLIRAIQSAPESVAIELLDQGISLDGNFRNTRYAQNIEIRVAALSGAVQRGWLDLFERLIQNSSLDGISQSQKNQMLMDAAKTNSPYLVSTLIKNGANLKLQKSSPLIAALDNEYTEPSKDADQVAVVRMLIESKIDIEAKDYIDWTALQHAYDEEPEIVSLLLAAGADVDAGSTDSISGDGSSSSILYITENEDIAILAIKAGADISLKVDGGKTLTQHAKEESWKSVLKLLAEKSR